MSLENETISRPSAHSEAALRSTASWAGDLKRTPAQLAGTVLIDELPNGGAPKAAYASLAEGRLQGQRTMLYRTTRPSDALVEQLRLKPFPAAANARHQYFYGPVDESAHRAFEACTEAERGALRETFVDQIERTVGRHVATFYQGAWATAVRGGTLTKEQYAETLRNLHQYVRFTTRLLGRAVAHSETPQLRAHYAMHLREEVNHEILLERDLVQLDEPVDFLVHDRYPNGATRSFMVLQQSLVSFELDTVMFAACPLAAEAIAAKMSGAFAESLRSVVASYDPKKEAKGATFFLSHVEADGGDDGHWAMTLRTLKTGLTTELRLGEFLSLLVLAAHALTSTFNGCVEDLALFSQPGRNA